MKAACRGVGLKRAQWSSQDGGVDRIGGRPLGGRPGALARPAAEPAHCFVYKSPPFLLFLWSPSPHLPPFPNSSQTAPAFRQLVGRRRLVSSGSCWTDGREVGEVPGQKWGGRAVLGEGSDFGRLSLPTCWGRTLCASGWESGGGKGGGAGDWTGWEGEAWGRWGPGRSGVPRPGPWGYGILSAGGGWRVASPTERYWVCSWVYLGVCTWQCVHECMCLPGAGFAGGPCSWVMCACPHGPTPAPTAVRGATYGSSGSPNLGTAGAPVPLPPDAWPEHLATSARKDGHLGAQRRAGRAQPCPLFSVLPARRGTRLVLGHRVEAEQGLPEPGVPRRDGCSPGLCCACPSSAALWLWGWELCGPWGIWQKPAAEGDQPVTVCWGAFWPQHCKSCLVGTPFAPQQVRMLPHSVARMFLFPSCPSLCYPSVSVCTQSAPPHPGSFPSLPAPSLPQGSLESHRPWHYFSSSLPSLQPGTPCAPVTLWGLSVSSPVPRMATLLVFRVCLSVVCLLPHLPSLPLVPALSPHCCSSVSGSPPSLGGPGLPPLPAPPYAPPGLAGVGARSGGCDQAGKGNPSRHDIYVRTSKQSRA